MVLEAEPLACRCHCYGTPTHCALSCMLNGRWIVSVSVCVCAMTTCSYWQCFLPRTGGTRQFCLQIKSSHSCVIRKCSFNLQSSRCCVFNFFLCPLCSHLLHYCCLHSVFWCTQCVVCFLFVFGRMQSSVYWSFWCSLVEASVFSLSEKSCESSSALLGNFLMLIFKV